MSSTLTSKGQVTIPRNFRVALGLEPGEQIEFKKNEAGELVLYPVKRRKTGKIEDLRGMLKYDGEPVDLLNVDVATLLSKRQKK